jgi:hypothetical protein
MHCYGPDSSEGPVSFVTRTMAARSRKPRRTPEEEEVRNRKPIRIDLVERIRQELAAGTYLTPEKWEAAMESLLSSLDWE